MPMILPALAGVGGSALAGFASKLPVLGNLVSGLGSFFGGDSGGGIEPSQAQRLQKAALRSGRNQARSQYRRELREVKRQQRLAIREARRVERRDDRVIQRRVRDAKAAGLHPLFALSGGLSQGISPAVTIGAPSVPTPSDPGTWFGGGGSSGNDWVGLGNSLVAMGQNLAPPAMEDPLDRMARVNNLRLQASQLQNDEMYRRLQLAQFMLEASQQRPGLPHDPSAYGMSRLPRFKSSGGGASSFDQGTANQILQTLSARPNPHLGLVAGTESATIPGSIVARSNLPWPLDELVLPNPNLETDSEIISAIMQLPDIAVGTAKLAGWKYWQNLKGLMGKPQPYQRLLRRGRSLGRWGQPRT